VSTFDYRLTQELDGELVDTAIYGHGMLRQQDVVVFMSLQLTQDPVTGQPKIEVVPHRTEFHLGGSQIRFDSIPMQPMLNFVAHYVNQWMLSTLSKLFAIVLQRETPYLAKSLASTMLETVSASTNEFLQHVEFPLSQWPRMVVEDPRWTVRDGSICVGMNWRHMDHAMVAVMQRLYPVRVLFHYDSPCASCLFV
jgi:hypothetical protein